MQKSLFSQIHPVLTCRDHVGGLEAALRTWLVVRLSFIREIELACCYNRHQANIKCPCQRLIESHQCPTAIVCKLLLNKKGKMQPGERQGAGREHGTGGDCGPPSWQAGRVWKEDSEHQRDAGCACGGNWEGLWSYILWACLSNFLPKEGLMVSLLHEPPTPGPVPELAPLPTPPGSRAASS